MTNPTEDSASKIILQGVHLELTAALQNTLRERISVLLRHDPRIVRIHVRLTQEQARGRNPLFSAAGRVELSGPDLVASVEGDEAYSLIDRLVDRLDEQLSDRHDRRTDKRNAGSHDDLAAKLGTPEA